MNMPDNHESEIKLMRARELVDDLDDEDTTLAEYKAISSVLDALETVFNTLRVPIVIDPSNLMHPMMKKGEAKAPKEEPEVNPSVDDRLEAMKAKQYL